MLAFYTIYLSTNSLKHSTNTWGIEFDKAGSTQDLFYLQDSLISLQLHTFKFCEMFVSEFVNNGIAIKYMSSYWPKCYSKRYDIRHM